MLFQTNTKLFQSSDFYLTLSPAVKIPNQSKVKVKVFGKSIVRVTSSSA